jgi:hypothetical protein
MTDKSKTLPGDAKDPNKRPNKEEELDEAVADSMIASDPPAVVSKGEPSAPKYPGKMEGGKTGKPEDRSKSGRD